MIFNSWIYLSFLTLTFLSYFLISKKITNILLFLFQVVFFMVHGALSFYF